MNKLQYIKLLELRGITKLEQGESVFAAIERSGGEWTPEEEIKVNNSLKEND